MGGNNIGDTAALALLDALEDAQARLVVLDLSHNGRESVGRYPVVAAVASNLI